MEPEPTTLPQPAQTGSRLRRAFLTIIILVGLTGGLWIGFTLLMGTSTPLFVVSSGSMIPTLEVGDLIIVRSMAVNELKIGDIITFHSPLTPDRIIVHRILQVVQTKDGGAGFITKGDHNQAADGWIVDQNSYVGTVVLVIPKVGFVSSILSPPTNYVLIVLILGLIFLSEIYPSKEKQPKTT
ncbi:MAG: signal peptidase I [Thaumarchaeota archaeon]|nr:signal peptidase I [Nitrososphaerota archaeon]